jgi:hypothetical protein
MKFGFENLGMGKRAAAPAEIGPQNTDAETMNLLKEKLRAAVAASPEDAAHFTEADIERTAIYAAIRQERTGAPYTKDSFSGAGSELDDQLIAALESRQAAKADTTPTQHVFGPDGIRIDSVSGRADAERTTEEERLNG